MKAEAGQEIEPTPRFIFVHIAVPFAAGMVTAAVVMVGVALALLRFKAML